MLCIVFQHSNLIQINNTHKIGVLYSKAGQTTEEQMYNNEFGSPAFYEFLEVLGHKVDLLGFDKENFRGGLDIRSKYFWQIYKKFSLFTNIFNRIETYI